MTIDLSPEALLSQLGYPTTEHTIEQMKRIIDNTNNFEQFSKHILSLHDNLAHVKGYIAMSNSNDYLKIKQGEEISNEVAEEFTNKVKSWANKYKVKLKKVDNKQTYYILGQ
jgi:predicted ATP-grasp superfamily ATP-dependent carboligase